MKAIYLEFLMDLIDCYNCFYNCFENSKMSEVLYFDKQVLVYKDLILINKYFFPLATSKTIMFSDIESIALQSAEGVDHRWGITSKYLNNWFPLDT